MSNALSNAKHWPRWPGSWRSMMLLMLCVRNFVLIWWPETDHIVLFLWDSVLNLNSHIVALKNAVWLTIDSDRPWKEGRFLNCNLKNQELKLRRKAKCWESNYDLSDQLKSEWLMLTELKAPSCGSE